MQFKKKGHLVGLDIGSAVIKVAEVQPSGKALKLNKFGMMPVPPGVIEEGQILDPEVLAELIRNLFKIHKINQKNVAIATGGASVVVKTITVPAVSEKALLDSIRFEAEQYIPYDIDEMNLDFQIMGSGEDDDPDQMNVLLVAVRKELVAEYIDLIEAAGLHMGVIDVDSFAFQNVYEQVLGDAIEPLNLLIDIGMSKTSLNIVKGNDSLMMRDSSSGINQIRNEIVTELDCSLEDAENIISGVDKASLAEESLNEIYSGFSKMWCVEIQNLVKTFQNKSLHGLINQIYLCGGGGLVRGFPDMLSDELAIPVSILNPFDGFKTSSKNFSEAFIQRATPFASIALGLALRKVDDK